MKTKDHKNSFETQTFKVSICKQKGCQFYDKQQAQGICFSQQPFIATMAFKYMEQLNLGAIDCVKEAKKLYKKYPTEDYINYLENQATTQWLQQIVSLDETIMLRRDNALLKLELDKLKNGKTTKTKAGKV